METSHEDYSSTEMTYDLQRAYFQSISFNEEVLHASPDLHAACERQSCDINDIVLDLIVSNPENVICRDDNGKIPLHHACINKASESVISLLLMSNPLGATINDPNDGRLPIHNACAVGPSSIGVIRTLLMAHPESVFEEDAHGNKPLDLAKKGVDHNKAEIIMAIEQCTVLVNSMERRYHEDIKEDNFVRDKETIIKSMRHEIDNLRGQLKDTRHRMKVECKELNEALSIESDQISILTQELNEAQDEAKYLKGEIKRLEDENNLLKDGTMKADNSPVSSTGANDETMDDSYQDSETSSMQCRINNMNIEMKEMKRNMKLLKHAANEAVRIERSQISELTKELNETQDKAKTLEKAVEPLLKENSQWTRKNIELVKESKACNDRLNHLKVEMAIIVEENDNLKTKVSILNSELNIAQSKIKNQEKENMTIMEENSILALHKEVQERESKEASCNVISLKEALEKLAADNHDLREEKLALSVKFNESHDEVIALRKLAEKLENNNLSPTDCSKFLTASEDALINRSPTGQEIESLEKSSDEIFSIWSDVSENQPKADNDTINFLYLLLSVFIGSLTTLPRDKEKENEEEEELSNINLDDEHNYNEQQTEKEKKCIKKRILSFWNFSKLLK